MPDTPQEPPTAGPEVPQEPCAGKPIREVLSSFIKELARLDRDARERVNNSRELATGERPTYRVSDVKAKIDCHAVSDGETLTVTDDEIQVHIEFSLTAFDGGEFRA